MVARRSLLVLALALAVVRCTDHPAAGPRTPMAPQALRWAPNVQPHFSAISSSSSGAGGDLNGDGVVDSTDTYVEHQLMGLWYREGDSPWSPVPVAHSLDDKSFISDLPHFSEWELCWVEDFMDWAVAW